ncbi:MAG: hypothetical protein KKE02_12285 [Alphaproteobacteria bacterium]|nr:hypothetical protein [Alphaproteobacteria bacterium]MBU1514053.1 hypothetical protein [Alphaproteobacteria bacterium]MBU2093007.1 hypothetical protein [Alphaproteobacteria bacterium]MBU2151790.1 hypothetical protein [Alphaproteobacteria bacterium]MBU2309390.1 hypothetical protein [Alphaproteobacteria bacterium]
MTNRTLSKIWISPGASARNGLGDPRSTGAPAVPAARKSLLNDRRSTR